ncbi:solute carrier organic anion transporter family member 1B3-like [Sapajus apella]|uniref:Solute carrier organic anion transporter family member n=1 Tax=Sapajus apella TaxID=9515 RepID=A0A6J3IMC7_SAPAP|nr:solute carrier organic anion transporter family member 1B3-like [Sapajus apella]
MFLAALSFSHIARTLSSSIMKSSITQIERRFGISSSLAGLIDGGFDIGNCLVILFVSYFGSKLHRPKIIGIGSFFTGIGSIFIALPHFFMGYYRYSKETNINSSENSTSTLFTCLINQTLSLNRTSSEIVGKGCGKEPGSHMWIYVFVGNVICGIGETPIMPLGFSYIDDFAKEGHSSFYVGILKGMSAIGPIVGFTIGSVFAKMYVDIGYVDLSTIRITPKDSRWVGAWWLGFLVSGLLSIISSIPFFFLPQNPNKPQKGRQDLVFVHVLKTNEERNQTPNLPNRGKNVTENVTGFIQSLKSILVNPRYILLILSIMLHLSSLFGNFTYILKYEEQQYGRTASQGNLLLGLTTVPCMAMGMYLGGYVIKKFQLTLSGIAKFSFFSATISFFFQLSHFALMCENKSVAGLTVSYDGNNPGASHLEVPLSYCNSECNCDESQWEPVCGNNGITYQSPCLAGCKSSSGNKNPIVFYDCPCVEVPGLRSRNYSASLGECPRSDACARKFYIYIIMQALIYFFFGLGGPSNIILTVRLVQPELKSLAVGFHTMLLRSVGGLLAPIYFGALIDRTCMKWSSDSCGRQGSCRIYNSTLFGWFYYSLTVGLIFLALVLQIILIYAMKKKYQEKETSFSENGRKVIHEANL